MRIPLSTALVSAFIALASCSSYYFASPQPVDRPDLLKIPRQLRGTWSLMELEENPTEKSNPPNYIVEKRRLKIIEADSVQFIDRMLTLAEAADKSGDGELKFAKMQRLDTSDGTLDTTLNFIVQGDLVYPVDEKGIGRGNSYTRSGDTIRFVMRDTVVHEVGHYFRIRKAEKNLWILNFLGGQEREANGWWLPSIVELRGKTVFFLSGSDKLQAYSTLIGKTPNRYYLNQDFKAAEIRRLMRDSIFTPDFKLVR